MYPPCMMRRMGGNVDKVLWVLNPPMQAIPEPRTKGRSSAIPDLIATGRVKYKSRYGILSNRCPCGAEEYFVGNPDERGEQALPWIAPMEFDTVAGIPFFRVWVVECSQCGTFQVVRTTIFNLKKIEEALAKQAGRPDTKIPEPRFAWESCSIEQFVAELRCEPNPAVILRVIEEFEECGWEFDALAELKKELSDPAPPPE